MVWPPSERSEQAVSRPASKASVPSSEQRERAVPRSSLAIIDNYAHIREHVEYFNEGFGVVPANEAYKLWVTYFVYALTH